MLEELYKELPLTIRVKDSRKSGRGRTSRKVNQTPIFCFNHWKHRVQWYGNIEATGLGSALPAKAAGQVSCARLANGIDGRVGSAKGGQALLSPSNGRMDDAIQTARSASALSDEATVTSETEDG